MNPNVRIVLVVAAMYVAKRIVIRSTAKAAYNHLKAQAEAPVGSEYYRKHQEMMRDPKLQRAFEILDRQFGK